jgi:hypothetical protein
VYIFNLPFVSRVNLEIYSYSISIKIKSHHFNKFNIFDTSNNLDDFNFIFKHYFIFGICRRKQCDGFEYKPVFTQTRKVYYLWFYIFVCYSIIHNDRDVQSYGEKVAHATCQIRQSSSNSCTEYEQDEDCKYKRWLNFKRKSTHRRS